MDQKCKGDKPIPADFPPTYTLRWEREGGLAKNKKPAMRSPDLFAIVTLAIKRGGHGVMTDGDTSTHQSGKIINQYPPSPHTLTRAYTLTSTD